MEFDASILVSGFAVSQIVSDDKHYSEFVCGHCEKLVSLDSVITETCNHPFCRKCLETIATECFMKQIACECPVCDADLSGSSMQFGAICVAARPLREAQPLAYKVLSLVQVLCPNDHGSHLCGWRGDYGDFLKHAVSHSAGVENDGNGEIQENGVSLNNTQAKTLPTENAIDSTTPATAEEKDVPKIDTDQGSLGNETKVSLKSRKSPLEDKSDGQNDNSSRPSGEQQAQWNSSIDSLDFWAEADGENNLTVDDDDDEEEGSYPEDVQEDEDSIKHDQTVKKAEKFKKQANAKFNKGEFSAAQRFYTSGIKTMTKIKLKSDEDYQLLSDMHSNRSVTYFREKDFQRCIEDCEVAIDYDPTLEKSWIRKWRGLMAQGDFENALSFLEEASQEIPKSKKIRTAFTKCSAEMGVFRDAQECMDKAEIPTAKKLLDACIDREECDNIVLLTFSARVDMSLAEPELAMEKINKVLRLNPEYVDALELRGFSYFLAGDTEEGAALLQEAYLRHQDSKQIKLALDRVQKTHAAYSKAKSAVTSGQYSEAIEHFTDAIQVSDPLPPMSHLFATLRTERAESYYKTNQFVCALKDCKEVVAVSQEYAPAWVVRSQVLIALGKVEVARKELAKARRSWGSDDSAIEEGYQRADFELRVLKVDADLEAFEEELANGTCDRLPSIVERARRRNSSLSTSKHQSMRNLKKPHNKDTMSMSIIDTSGMGLDGKANGRESFSNPLRGAKRSSSFSEESHQDQREQRRGSRRNSIGDSSMDSGDRGRNEERRASRRSSINTSDKSDRALNQTRAGRRGSREGSVVEANERRSSGTGERKSSSTRRTSEASRKKRPDNTS